MPRIGNPFSNVREAYDPGQSLGRSITQLGDALMPDPLRQAQGAQILLNMDRLRREEGGIGRLAAGFRAGNTDTRELLAAGVEAGIAPRNVIQGQTAIVHNDPNTTPDQRMRAALGAGEAIGGTEVGQQRQIASAERQNALTTERQQAAQRYATDNTYETMFNPQGVAVPVPRSEIRQRVAEGWRAATTPGAVQANEATSVLRRPEITDRQRSDYAGVTSAPADRAPRTYTVEGQNGARLRSGITVDGVTDVNTGQPIISAEEAAAGVNRAVISVTAQVPGVSSTFNNSEVSQARERSITGEQTTRGALGVIRQTQDLLAQPNSAGAMGLVGRLAQGVNELRSQLGAAVQATTGIGAEQEIGRVSQEWERVSGNNQRLLQTAQSLGLDAGRLRAVLYDLAYSIAKSNDPSGRMSNQDVENALRIIGADAGDPANMSRILDDIGERLAAQHNSRVQDYRTQYGAAFGLNPAFGQLRHERRNAPLLGGQPAPANTDAAPGPAAPAQAPQLERWGRDVNGRPVRLQ